MTERVKEINKKRIKVPLFFPLVSLYPCILLNLSRTLSCSDKEVNFATDTGVLFL